MPSSAYETVTEASETAKKVVKRTAAVYNRNGNKTISTYSSLTWGSVKYYKISKTANMFSLPTSTAATSRSCTVQPFTART
ncbi:hypothetical protein LOB66_07865 [Lactobacillus delbrueckii subsp. lactis]|uniref:hypothetical protein n=1 Tax=Lactobacillus delbrueckii TaxID=1584 RepID=UPI001E4B2C1E|nr:hypothetical protein [Lactobacillus delbrueckii]MCD5494460.1 hypothetical protein [Lactobacillus delbrueckii subsp. lactis]